MHVTLDTSVLVRFFTDDIPTKALEVQKLLESDHKKSVPDSVFPELEYVLTTGYKASRSDILTIFRFLSGNPKISSTPLIKKAVIIYENTALDMADCIVAADSLRGALASYDKRLLHTPGVTPYWKK